MPQIQTGQGPMFITGARLASLTGLGGPENGQAGIVAPVLGGSATYSGAARTVYLRFVPSRVMTIVGASFATIVAAAANDTIELGIMDSAGSRMVTSGAVAGVLNTAAGAKTVNFAATDLTPGAVYYAAMATTAPGGAAAQLCARNLAGGACWELAGATFPTVECATESAVTAIPATAGALTANIAAYPHLFLRET